MPFVKLKNIRIIFVMIYTHDNIDHCIIAKYLPYIISFFLLATIVANIAAATSTIKFQNT